MKYVKVFLAIMIFFLVMMFFVQNQSALSQVIPLTLDLFFIEPMMSKPISIYALLLICFLIGSLVTLALLIWDRLRLSAHLALANIRIRTLEKDIEHIAKEKNNYETQNKKLDQSFLEN